MIQWLKKKSGRMPEGIGSGRANGNGGHYRALDTVAKILMVTLTTITAAGLAWQHGSNAPIGYVGPLHCSFYCRKSPWLHRLTGQCKIAMIDRVSRCT